MKALADQGRGNGQGHPTGDVLPLGAWGARLPFKSTGSQRATGVNSRGQAAGPDSQISATRALKGPSAHQRMVVTPAVTAPMLETRDLL